MTFSERSYPGDEYKNQRNDWKEEQPMNTPVNNFWWLFIYFTHTNRSVGKENMADGNAAYRRA